MARDSAATRTASARRGARDERRRMRALPDPAAGPGGGPAGPRGDAGDSARRPVPAWRRAVGTVGVVLLLALAALAVAVAVVPVVVGGSPLTVLSPSMTPTYPPGTLVVTRPRPLDRIRIGDVVAFTDRDPVTGSTRTVTHRVVGIDPGPAFRTKGDANADPDPEVVTTTDVQGVVWYSLPWVGGWGVALRDGPGLLAGFGGILIVIALMVLVPRPRSGARAAGRRTGEPPSGAWNRRG